MPYDHDLITLGAGSGGVAASRRAAALGARVAVIEGGRVGGTCVIRGCVPKKLLMYAAQYGDALQEAAGYGWTGLAGARFDMAHWARSKAAEIDRLEGIYRKLLADSGVMLVEGWARLHDAHTVVISGPAGEHRLTARHILIATGASPVRNSLPGIDTCPTSNELLDLQHVPRRAAVIGAGYVALEFASMLVRLGSEVSVFYRDTLPLRGFDTDLRTRLAQALSGAGVSLHPGGAPQAISLQASGGHTLHWADGRSDDGFDFVLNATGRAPNTTSLGLDAAGVRTTASGAVEVDNALCTSADGVYAIGDVTDRPNLTPVAIAEGRALAERLFGPGRPMPELEGLATAVFTLPPLGTAGSTETQALEQAGPAHADGRPRLKIFEADFRPMRQAFIDGTERAYMKLVVDADSDRVLGVHMLGADAPEIVQSLAVALRCGATKAQFDRTIAVHPTAAEEFVLMREPSRLVR